MALSDQLEAIAEVARARAEPGEEVSAVIPCEPGPGVRIYLCAFESEVGRVWLALDEGGQPVADRTLVRASVSVAALCELAEQTAGGGDLAELGRRLAELRETERPEGIEEAEEALAALEATIEAAPRLASAAYLDRIGGATRQLEQALGQIGTSPFAEAMKGGAAAIEGLAAEVEQSYRLPLAR